MLNLAAANSKKSVYIIHENFFSWICSPTLRLCMIHVCYIQIMMVYISASSFQIKLVLLFLLTGLPNFRHGISPPTDIKPSDIRALLDEIPIERNRITLGEILLEGKIYIH